MHDDLAALAGQLEGFFARRAPLQTDAQDLAQETMVRALARWGQLRQPQATRAWVFSIAHNLLRDRYRDTALAPVPMRAMPDRSDAGGGPQWRSAVRQAVATALGTLHVQQRHVLILRLFDDLPFAEIGRRLGVPEATARTRAHHGIRRLRAAVATHLRQDGWLVECTTVRERLQRMAFGLAPGRVKEELRRHMAACAGCRQEAELVTAMWEGATAHAALPVMVAGWMLHDVAGRATSYWLSLDVNGGNAPREEWGINSSFAPEAWTWFDGDGRPLQEVRHWRGERYWGIRLRLNAPWQPGATVRVVGAVPMRLAVEPSDGGGTWTWSELPLSATDGGVPEMLCRRALQLPPGYRAVACDPEPDHLLGDGALCAWSRIVAAGECLRLQVVFVPR